MTKQLVSLFLLLGALGAGCASVSTEDRTPETLPARSFAEKWRAELDVKAGGVTALYLRDDTLFAYSQSRLIYRLDRASGRLIQVDDVGPNALRIGPPVILDTDVVYPLATSLVLVNNSTRDVRTIALPLTVRTPGEVWKSRNTIFLGADLPRGPHVIAFDVTNPRPVPRWTIMTQGSFQGQPALHQNVLFVGSEDSRVYAMTVDGEAAWPLVGSSFKTDGPIQTDVRADDFGVYVASTDGKLYCLDRGTGKIKWRYFSGRPLGASPTVTSRYVYQYVPGTGLACINKMDGELNRPASWIARDGRQLLAEDQTYAYISTSDNRIEARNLLTGEAEFISGRHNFAFFVTNTIDNTIYAATRDGHVIAVRPELRGGTVGLLVVRPTEDDSQG